MHPLGDLGFQWPMQTELPTEPVAHALSPSDNANDPPIQTELPTDPVAHAFSPLQAPNGPPIQTELPTD
jgi:hypothetical protein